MEQRYGVAGQTNGVWFSTLALHYLNYLIDNLLHVVVGRKA